MDKPTDQELIEQARAGDSQAFGSLVHRHQKRIFRLAIHILHNESEAEEVTQETFVRAFEGIDRFRGNSQPYTWLYRIAVNLSLNIIRARKPRQRLVDASDPRVETWLASIPSEPQADPAEVSERRQLAVELCNAIEELSPSLRTTLILVCVEGVPHDQAAAALGCPEGTIAWRVHEARRRLREHLSNRGFATPGDQT